VPSDWIDGFCGLSEQKPTKGNKTKFDAYYFGTLTTHLGCARILSGIIYLFLGYLLL
jgi:hypothetical protein